MNAAPPLGPRFFFDRLLTLRHFLTVRRATAVALAVGLPTVAAGLGWSRAAKSPPAAAATQPLAVEVSALAPQDGYRTTRAYSGTVRARRTSPLSFRRTAELTRVLVD